MYRACEAVDHWLKAKWTYEWGIAALAAGVYDLTLPSGLVFQLKNCYYVPTVSRNIISVSCLDVDGFHFIIKNNIFSIYNADIFMGMLIYLMVSMF